MNHSRESKSLLMLLTLFLLFDEKMILVPLYFGSSSVGLSSFRIIVELLRHSDKNDPFTNHVKNEVFQHQTLISRMTFALVVNAIGIVISFLPSCIHWRAYYRLDGLNEALSV